MARILAGGHRGCADDPDRTGPALRLLAVEKHIASIFQKLRRPPSESENRRVLAVLAYLEQSGDE